MVSEEGMGRQGKEDDDSWELLNESVLRELSPLQERDTSRRGLFQRINRERATYFADVEEARYNSQSGSAAGGKGQEESSGRARKLASLDSPRQLSSGFADLSTWCCDAFLPTRSNLTPGEEQKVWLVSSADQPTIILPRLAAVPFQVADMPTAPLLPVIAASAPANASFGDISWNGKRQQRLFRLLRRFWRIWRSYACRTERPRMPPQPVRAKGRELLQQRLRERRLQGTAPRTLPTPPGGKRGPITRPPTDRLFG